MTVDGLRAIVALCRRNPTVKDIQISDNNLGDEGATLLTHFLLKGARKRKEKEVAYTLGLARNNFSGPAVAMLLAAAEANGGVEELDLSGNSLPSWNSSEEDSRRLLAQGTDALSSPSRTSVSSSSISPPSRSPITHRFSSSSAASALPVVTTAAAATAATAGENEGSFSSFFCDQVILGPCPNLDRKRCRSPAKRRSTNGIKEKGDEVGGREEVEGEGGREKEERGGGGGGRKRYVGPRGEHASSIMRRVAEKAINNGLLQVSLIDEIFSRS